VPKRASAAAVVKIFTFEASTRAVAARQRNSTRPSAASAT
jgi:hypothetical protein